MINEEDIEEFRESLTTVMAMCKVLHDTAILVGFTEPQAMAIAISHLNNLFSGGNKDED